MSTPPVYTVHLTGNIPGDTPCFCMRCPECRGYVMDTREPIDPRGRAGDWRPNRRDLLEQAKAMEVEANEGRPAVLTRDEESRPGGRGKKRGPYSEGRKLIARGKAIRRLKDKIERMDAELNQLKGNTE